jgi:hypothetical protein
MAIDSKKKRKGASAPPQPAATVPFPDGTVSSADMAVLSGEYVPTLMAADESTRRGFKFFGDEDCFTWKPRYA